MTVNDSLPFPSEDLIDSVCSNQAHSRTVEVSLSVLYVAGVVAKVISKQKMKNEETSKLVSLNFQVVIS